MNNHQRSNSTSDSDFPQQQSEMVTDTSSCDQPQGGYQTSSQKYVDEWERFFIKPAQYVSFIQKQAMDGKLRSCRFRSICWRIYLECLSDDQTTWLDETNRARCKYAALKSKFLTNPRIEDMTEDLSLNNPLSQDETSPWNRYFQDSELKITIRQDVIRTFPEIEFFHSSEIREMMVNILFCYARYFPQMSYKQGMHEILAPIIFILRSDHQAFLHASEIELTPFCDPNSRNNVQVLLNPKFIEHDSFYMFSQVMEVIEPWYIIRDIYPQKSNSMSVRLFARPQDMNPTNVIIFKLSRIYDHLLKRHDSQLYHHLEKLEIAPQIYGIRWLRLLFGREFPLQDLLVIWDVIFADSMAFDLVDYIFVSMLIFILLSSDYASCLTCLMKYPAVADVQYIMEVALHLRDPNNNPKPCGYSSHMLQHKPTVGGRMDIHRGPKTNLGDNFKDQSKAGVQKNSAMTSGFATMSQKMIQRPKTLSLNSDITGGLSSAKASSEPATFDSSSPSPPLTESLHEHSKVVNLRSSTGAITELQLLQNKSDRFVARYKNDDDDEADKKLNRGGSWPFKRNKELKNKCDVDDKPRLQGQLHDLQAMNAYCSSKMTIHLDRLQDCVLKQSLDCEDEMLIALAGLKQVRDILKGTLKFSSNILDGDDIVINDNHYQVESAKYVSSLMKSKDNNAVELVEH
uniref:Rab-GAP TBC domain-containing protein n=1 Tax=Strigamia maritima TaxID=126957 RepID=T1JG27_STRMM